MRELTSSELPEIWIPVDNLCIVWVRAQRGLSQSHVDKMKADFDPYAFGIIVVTMPNDNDMYHVIDGQHRVEMIRQMWGGAQRVPCRVIGVADPQRAAEIWLKMNLCRTAPTQIDRFLIAVYAGRQPETEVYGLIRGHGYTVENKAGEGILRAVNACVTVRSRWGVLALKCTLEDVQACWGMDRNATHQAILMGFGELHGLHRMELDRGRLVAQLKKDTAGNDPHSLIASGRTRRDALGGSLGANIAEVLRKLYNTGKRTTRLESPA